VTRTSEFESFYQASYGQIVALLLGVLGDRQEAEDAAQEAFVRALARWPRLSSYDVPEGLISSFPVTCSGGSYEIVQGLELNDFSISRIAVTVNELGDEREAVKQLDLI